MKYTSANTNTPIECVYKDVVIIGKYSMNEKLKIKHIFINAYARREYIAYHLPTKTNRTTMSATTTTAKERNEKKNAQTECPWAIEKRFKCHTHIALSLNVYIYESYDSHKKGMK